ncbi:hypothetical protein F5X68DRAFT_30343 [Plectosphaerella plurivora]|uniref:Uncharacterized protein n=1 Tax=Plectosphaerella plurivora TaxID=936078 RepID=A0A9P8VKY2_9PEZI|nr:hypothetical protein F5X68DRAFT_30343 [Plectosphaerella plurivora]
MAVVTRNLAAPMRLVCSPPSSPPGLTQTLPVTFPRRINKSTSATSSTTSKVAWTDTPTVCRSAAVQFPQHHNNVNDDHSSRDSQGGLGRAIQLFATSCGALQRTDSYDTLNVGSPPRSPRGGHCRLNLATCQLPAPSGHGFFSYSQHRPLSPPFPGIALSAQSWQRAKTVLTVPAARIISTPSMPTTTPTIPGADLVVSSRAAFFGSCYVSFSSCPRLSWRHASYTAGV